MARPRARRLSRETRRKFREDQAVETEEPKKSPAKKSAAKKAASSDD